MNPYQSKLAQLPNPPNDIQIAMQNGLLRLYIKKNIAHITVKALCEQTPVARTTFYAYYMNLDTLLEEMEDNCVGNLIAINNPYDDNRIDIGLFLTNTLTYLTEHRDLFWAFLIKQPNNRFIGKWKSAIKYQFWNLYYHDGIKPNSELILELIASAAIGAYSYWLMNPEDIDVDKFNRMIVMTFEMVDVDV